MSDKNNISEASEGILKMSFNEKSDDEEDIEALKAATKAKQRKLSSALNQARKAEKAKAKTKTQTKPIVSLLVNYPKSLVKWQALGLAESLTTVTQRAYNILLFASTGARYDGQKWTCWKDQAEALQIRKEL